MSFVQLDMEVIFYYTDVSIDGVVTDEANSMNDQFNYNQGGSAHTIWPFWFACLN